MQYQGICRICGNEGKVEGKYNRKCTKCGRIATWLFRAKQPCTKENVLKYSLIYTKMVSDSKGKCEICKQDSTKFHFGLVLDHNHKTNKIRGLICGPCNNSLGSIGEDLNTLKAMIVYLEKYNII